LLSCQHGYRPTGDPHGRAFAVADVFWRSGQTKVNGFSIREETFYLFREEYKVPLLPPEVAA
jgi:hypothetical protein